MNNVNRTALAVTRTQPWVKRAPLALRNPRLLDATTNRTALAVKGSQTWVKPTYWVKPTDWVKPMVEL